jgi:lysophospholipase L1-like esterase
MSVAKSLCRSVVQPIARRLTAAGLGIGSSINDYVFDLIQEASSKKINLFGLSDSNELFNGNGWNDGWHERFSEVYGLHATGLLCTMCNNGNGYAIGNTYQEGVKYPSYTGARAEWARYAENLSAPSLGNLIRYGYVETTFNSVAPIGMVLRDPCLLDKTNMQFQQWYCQAPGEGGSFSMYARIADPPYSWIKWQTGQVIDGPLNVTMTPMDIPEGPREYPVELGTTINGGNAIIGPACFLYQRVVDKNLTSGVSYISLCYLGGQGLRGFANGLANQTDEYYQTMLAELHRIDGGPFVFIINSGLNDRNDTNNSVGNNPTDSSTPEGYVDNLDACIRKISEQCDAIGKTDYGFLVMPSHPISNPDDAKLVSYRQAAKNYAADKTKVSVVDLNELIGFDEMDANGWYASAGDRAHLSPSGYKGVATTVADFIMV